MDVIWTAEFANAGWIQPWEGELEQQVTDGTFDSVVEGASFEGKLYAAPFTSNTQLLWYRKDRVEKVPKTWEEMLAESERIGEDGVIQVQADQYEGFVVWVNAMIESAGATVLEGPETVGLEQEATEAALETMAKFASLRCGGYRHRHVHGGHRAPFVRGRRLLIHAELSLRLPEREGERARRLQADGSRPRIPRSSTASRRRRRSEASTWASRSSRRTPTSPSRRQPAWSSPRTS